MLTETENLLQEFPPVSTEAWEAAIVRDLKGADYAKRLIKDTGEGLPVKPYYRAEDLPAQARMDAAPDEFPYRRGTRATGDWQIRDEIDATDAVTANGAARAAVAAGAEAIAFSKILIENAGELDTLLRNLEAVPVHFAFADERLIRLLINRLKNSQNAAGISTGCDALANLDFVAETIAAAPSNLVPFTIDAGIFEEAGATAAEETGLALAAGIDFLAAMNQRGVAPARAAAAIEFSFAIGANYFFQIAKFRAFRALWTRATESFGVPRDAARARIAARTSRWNKTVYDPHVNILRMTTESMAAVLGGADAVTVAPFDACYTTPHEASHRLARNTQLLLKHEAWLGRIADAGGGSYYLEALTDFLAANGWKIMQQIESRGGFTEAQGFVAQMLDRSMAAREKSVASRRRVFVGTNQYANPLERALDRMDGRQSSPPRRATQAYEQLRLRTERHVAAGGSTPRVLLAEIGDAKMRTARARFAANFFACAGFEMTTKRFKKAEEVAELPADLIVLCSADQEYAALAAKLIPRVQALHRQTPVIIAGNPEDAAQLAAAGIADFVHVRSNAVEFLTKWQKQLGVNG